MGQVDNGAGVLCGKVCAGNVRQGVWQSALQQGKAQRAWWGWGGWGYPSGNGKGNVGSPGKVKC